MATTSGAIATFQGPIRVTMANGTRSGATPPSLPGTLRGNRLIGGGGASTTQVINRVFDSVAGDFVFWKTDSPDTGGSNYPGPGTFGADTSDYVVEDQEV